MHSTYSPGLPSPPGLIKNAYGSLVDSSITANSSNTTALLDEVERVVQVARDKTETSLFPASFASADGWRQTMEIGCDWVRLGAYLDSQFPVDEARDLLAGGGPQPTFRTSDTALAAA